MAVATFTKSGTKATTAAKLDKAVFEVKPENHELLKAAYVAYLANGRENAAKVKNRGDVSGGGKKPWKQKGTGRARFGSSRNPIWRGGGAAFGPTGTENYTHRMPVAQKRLAIRQALSVAADEGRVIVVEALELKGKTAEAVKFFEKIGATKNTLVVVASKTAEAVRATNNLPNIKLVQAQYVNVFDAVNADAIVVASDALPVLSEWLGGKA